jgi:hypothetical protein
MFWRLRLAQPQPQKWGRRRDAAQLLFLNCLTQFSPVTISQPSLRTFAPPLFTTCLRRTQGFWMKGGFLMGGGLAEGNCLEGDCWRGKWIAEGSIAEGKELLKKNCWRIRQRGIAKDGLIELVGSLQGNGHCWLSASLRTETLWKLKREHGTVQVCTMNFIHRL